MLGPKRSITLLSNHLICSLIDLQLNTSPNLKSVAIDLLTN